MVKTPKFACYLLLNGILGDKRPASGNVLTREVLDALLALHASPRRAAAGVRRGLQRWAGALEAGECDIQAHSL